MVIKSYAIFLHQDVMAGILTFKNKFVDNEIVFDMKLHINTNYDESNFKDINSLEYVEPIL